MKILYPVVFFAALGGILSGFDTGVISGAVLYINDEWNLNEYQTGVLIASALTGAIFGAFLNGKLADILGRKKLFFITALIFFTGSILCAVSSDITKLILSRIVVGFAIGIITFLSPLYLSEISPKKIRGALVSAFQLAITLGILFSYISNAFFTLFYENWRIMLLMGIIPAFILMTGVFFIPDTPRFYILKGENKKAEETILRLGMDSEDIFDEISPVKKEIKFGKCMVLPLVIGIGCMFIQQWTGINTIIYYAPVILQNAGFDTNSSAISAAVGIGILNFLSTFIAIFTSDKIGRKPLLYIGLSGMGLCLLFLGIIFKYSYIFGVNSRYFALFACALYITFFAMSLGPVMILLVSEIFPLKIRSVMMSISMMFNFIFNFAVSLLFLPMIKFFGGCKTFTIFAIISFLGIIFVWKLIPETKGKSLEIIEKNWIENV
ncbi:MAG: sugar porter family MFS transporter [Candidatus Gastranaerophilales bacterium]|nr:sugar porter family MFS transporter [Candidatus Gastranaerophilales bacterium]